MLVDKFIILSRVITLQSGLPVRYLHLGCKSTLALRPQSSSFIGCKRYLATETDPAMKPTTTAQSALVNSNGRKKLVILGTGWASYAVLKNIDKKLYDVVVVSPRNHFLFTPLLCSTTVGTLEFR